MKPTFTLIPGQNFPPCFDNGFQNLKSIVLQGESSVRVAAVMATANKQAVYTLNAKTPDRLAIKGHLSCTF